MKTNDCSTMTEDEIRPRDLCHGQVEACRHDLEKLQKQKAGFVKSACPACGCAQACDKFEKCTFLFVECGACGTIYMSPRPTPEIMAQYYQHSENYAYWAKFIFPRSENARKEKLYKPRIEKLRQLCEKRGVTSGRLLEVGAGFGAFAEVAKESGFLGDVVVVEPTPEMAAACRGRGLIVLEKSIESVGDELPPVDIIVSFEVIEHLFAPMDFFRQARRLLKPGGLLLVTCPNGKGFDIRMLAALSTAVDSEHITLFNPESLKKVFEVNGFCDIHIETPGRLDAELVRNAVLAGEFALSSPFLKRVLIEEWEVLGPSFQQFLADNSLSSHMWGYAQKM